MKTTTITREELYDQVWSKPMRRIATLYRISDTDLAAVCLKHNIPCPPKGYWARKKLGTAPPPTPLPDTGDNPEVTLRDHGSCRISPPAPQATVNKASGEEKRREEPIVVGETLRGAHALVSQANQELQAADTDEHHLIIVPEKASLCIRVSKTSLRRALLIMDAILKGLEDRGYQVEAGPMVRIPNAHLSFNITEALDTQREQPEEHDLSGYYEFGHSRFNTKRLPSGRLILSIEGGYWANGYRKTWRDADKQRLEDRLSHFVAGLLRIAARKKEYEEEQKQRAQEQREQERRQKEETERRAEKRRLFQAEKARLDSLMHEVECWAASQSLRRYIDARRQKHLNDHGAIGLGSEFADWLRWAVQQADRLDPTVASPPSILDEPVPEEPKPWSWWERS